MNDKPRPRYHINDRTKWLDSELLEEIRRLNPCHEGSVLKEKTIIPEHLIRQITKRQLEMVPVELNRLSSRDDITQPAGLLALRMAARGYGKLFDHIKHVGTFSIGEKYKILNLLDFGSQSLLFSGEDFNQSSIAIKLPFVDYTNLAYLDVDQLKRRRERLVHEAEILKICRGTAFPEFITEQLGPNPFFPLGFPSFLRDNERFLIVEKIDGIRVDSYARTLHCENRLCCARRLAVQFGIAFLAHAAEIVKRIGPYAIYTDIKPENALIKASTIRIVDASSIMTDHGNESSMAITKLYLDPLDYERQTRGELLPDSAFTIRSVARCMRMLVTNEPLLVGKCSSPWSDDSEGDLGRIVEELLAVESPDLSASVDILRKLLCQLACPHGKGALFVHQRGSTPPSCNGQVKTDTPLRHM